MRVPTTQAPGTNVEHRTILYQRYTRIMGVYSPSTRTTLHHPVLLVWLAIKTLPLFTTLGCRTGIAGKCIHHRARVLHASLETEQISGASTRARSVSSRAERVPPVEAIDVSFVPSFPTASQEIPNRSPAPPLRYPHPAVAPLSMRAPGLSRKGLK